MRGQTIGKTMPHGYAGSYSRQPDMIVDSHPLEGDAAVVFGQAVVYGTFAMFPEHWTGSRECRAKGRCKTVSMGDTSVSYDNSAVTAGTEKWGSWNTTQYGSQLVTMARMVGMGGMYAI